MRSHAIAGHRAVLGHMEPEARTIWRSTGEEFLTAWVPDTPGMPPAPWLDYAPPRASRRRRLRRIMKPTFRSPAGTYPWDNCLVSIRSRPMAKPASTPRSPGMAQLGVPPLVLNFASCARRLRVRNSVVAASRGWVEEMGRATRKSGWRWCAGHAVVFGVVLTSVFTWSVIRDGNDDGGGIMTLWNALLYLVPAGFVTTLRTRSVLDAGRVGIVVGPLGFVIAIIAIPVASHVSIWPIGLVFVPGMALMGALCTTIGGVIADRLRWMAMLYACSPIRA